MLPEENQEPIKPKTKEKINQGHEMWVTWYLFSIGYELHYRNENIKKKITNRKKGLISSIGKKKVLSYIIN